MVVRLLPHLAPWSGVLGRQDSPFPKHCLILKLGIAIGFLWVPDGCGCGRDYNQHVGWRRLTTYPPWMTFCHLFPSLANGLDWASGWT